MGTRAPNTIHISIDDLRQPRTFLPSASVSDEDEDGVQVSPQGPSPQYSIIQPPDAHSGPSSHSGDGGVFPLPLAYPLDIPEAEAEPEVHPYHSTHRPPHRHRHPSDASRSSSAQRDSSRRTIQLQAPYRAHHMPPSDSVADEAESTEAFLQGPEHAVRMPRGQSYHHHPGYTHSSSSSSYTYPQVPHQSHQMVAYAPPVPYTHPLPAPYAYPPQQPHAYPPHLQPHPAHNMTTPYAHPPVHQYPAGYFQHYAQIPQNPYYASPFPGVPSPMAPYVQYPIAPQPDHLRALTASPSHIAPVQVTSPPAVDENAMLERFQALLLAERAERDKKEKERQTEALSAEERVAAMRVAERERREVENRIRAEAVRAAEEEALAQRRRDADRRAEEARIREDATREALEAEKARVAAEAERVAREAKIRKEAAEAALAAAAAEAKAKQQQADREAKIAADATEAAKNAATKEAKTAADAAEAAVSAAKKEAEAVQAKMAGLARPEKKAPLKFKDALGRTFNFPWDRCCKWDDMEALINQAFAHIENIGPHVKQGHYDLIGPDKEIIMPDYWEDSITPGMQVSMMLWPIPEPPPPPMDPLTAGLLPLDDDMVDVATLLANAKRSNKHKSNSSKKKPGGGLQNWLLGGTAGARARPSSKDSKKPEFVVVTRHGATDAGACIVM